MKVYHIGTFVWLGTLTIVHGSMRCGCRNRGAGGRSSPPDFGTSINLYISIRGGADYARNIMYYSPSRIFRSSYGPVTEAGFSSESFLHGR